MPDEEALAFLVNNDFSKSQYQAIRMNSLNHNSNVYPSYKKVRIAKNKCLPKNINISESNANVPLQDLLDHTTARLLEVQEEVFLSQFQDSDIDLKGVLISKWGFDGATGQSTYKQKHNPETNPSPFYEDSIIFTSLVPLDLCINKKLIWRNPAPSSNRYCRPVELAYKKETAESSLNLKTIIDNQISQLKPTLITIEDSDNDNKQLTVEISHILQMTSVDGKVINAAVSNTSQQCCYLCGATPKEMNAVNNYNKKVINKIPLSYGLSTLHARIRCFEAILHIAYRLKVKKWQIRGAKDKEITAAEKLRIQKEFRVKMGLVVDKPRAGGSGNSNDGNTARRAFKNITLFSQITNVDCELIKKLATILGVITCGFEINSLKFAIYCKETLNLYVSLYPWFFMPVTLHKILVHGPVIVKRMCLPIGLFSEEAQERRNKDIKSYRLHHSRKDSRMHTIDDQFRTLLVTSDPMISSKKNFTNKHKQSFSKEMIELLDVEHNYIDEPLEVEEDTDDDNESNSSEILEIEDDIVTSSVDNVDPPIDFYEDTFESDDNLDVHHFYRD